MTQVFREAVSIEQLNVLSRNTAIESLGIVFSAAGEDWLQATMPVDERTRQPYGILHGGASVVLAETLGSSAGNLCVDTAKQIDRRRTADLPGPAGGRARAAAGRGAGGDGRRRHAARGSGGSLPAAPPAPAVPGADHPEPDHGNDVGAAPAGPAGCRQAPRSIGFVLSSAFSAIVVYAQEMMPHRIGMVSGLFFGFAFGMGGLGAAVLGLLADKTSIEYVYQLTAFLPLLGIVAAWLPPSRPAAH